MVYVVVNAFLWLIWLTGDGGYPWPIWPALGWGIGVALNGWSVYQRPLTEDDVRREMARLRR